MFNKKEEIFENFCEKDVPIFRAVWYIKVRMIVRPSLFLLSPHFLARAMWCSIHRIFHVPVYTCMYT